MATTENPPLTGNETWMAIDGFPGYEVSDAGHVRGHLSMDTVPPAWRPRTPIWELLHRQWSNGHIRVCLRDSAGTPLPRYVKGLVARAFLIPDADPDDRVFVELKDGDATNCSVGNLAIKAGPSPVNQRPVRGWKDGRIALEFPSIAAAAYSIGVSDTTMWRLCRNRLTAGGFLWTYADAEPPTKPACVSLPLVEAPAPKPEPELDPEIDAAEEEASPAEESKPEGLLTEADVAAILQVYPTTIAALRKTGRGPKYLQLGRYARYRREDVDAWVAESVK